MSITKQNYEQYALDYLEGELPPSIAKEMQLFLKENPSIAEEIEALRGIVLVPDNRLIFKDKDVLKRKAKVIPFFYRKRVWLIAASFSGIIFLGGYWLSKEQTIAITPDVIAKQTMRGDSSEKPAVEALEVVEDNDVELPEAIAKEVISKEKPVVTATPPRESVRHHKTTEVKLDSHPKTIITSPPKISSTPSPIANTTINPKTINQVPVEKRQHSPTLPELVEPIEKEVIVVEEIASTPLNEEEKENTNPPIQEEIMSKPVEEELAIMTPEKSKKRGVKLRLFSKLQDLSGNDLRRALLPESMTSAETTKRAADK